MNYFKIYKKIILTGLEKFCKSKNNLIQKK